jgi:hypothetical protein
MSSVTLGRLRRVQESLRHVGVDALVVILGLDSVFNDEQYQFFDYLFPSLRAANPTLDNVVLVTMQTELHVLLDNISRPLLLPLIMFAGPRVFHQFVPC